MSEEENYVGEYEIEGGKFVFSHEELSFGVSDKNAYMLRNGNMERMCGMGHLSEAVARGVVKQSAVLPPHDKMAIMVDKNYKICLHNASTSREVFKINKEIPSFPYMCKEIALHSRIPNHPNVLHMNYAGYDFEAGRAFMSLEEAPLSDLWNVIAHLESFPPEAARGVLFDVKEGLSAIHGVDVCHRDIKPENILVTVLGTVKIGDFGVSCHMVKGEARDSEVGTRGKNRFTKYEGKIPKMPLPPKVQTRKSVLAWEAQVKTIEYLQRKLKYTRELLDDVGVAFTIAALIGCLYPGIWEISEEIFKTGDVHQGNLYTEEYIKRVFATSPARGTMLFLLIDLLDSKENAWRDYKAAFPYTDQERAIRRDHMTRIVEHSKYTNLGLLSAQVPIIETHIITLMNICELLQISLGKLTIGIYSGTLLKKHPEFVGEDSVLTLNQRAVLKAASEAKMNPSAIHAKIVSETYHHSIGAFLEHNKVLPWALWMYDDFERSGHLSEANYLRYELSDYSLMMDRLTPEERDNADIKRLLRAAVIMGCMLQAEEDKRLAFEEEQYQRIKREDLNTLVRQYAKNLNAVSPAEAERNVTAQRELKKQVTAATNLAEKLIAEVNDRRQEEMEETSTKTEKPSKTPKRARKQQESSEEGTTKPESSRSNKTPRM